MEENSLTDQELLEADAVVQQTIEANAGNCRIVAANLTLWSEFVRREAILFDTLNRFGACVVA